MLSQKQVGELTVIAQQQGIKVETLLSRIVRRYVNRSQKSGNMKDAIVKALQKKKLTTEELSDLAFGYRARISELRGKGMNITANYDKSRRTHVYSLEQ